jgi:hypothetical protein
MDHDEYQRPTTFALFFLAMWICVGFGVGLLSGWHELARAYRHPGGFVGARWRFQSGQMRLAMGYHSVLTVDASPQGLYLATVVLFRAGHPTMLIPWNDVSVRPGQIPLLGYTEYRFRQAPYAFLRPSPSLTEKLRLAGGDFWPLD